METTVAYMYFRASSVMCSSLGTQQLTSLYIPLFNCRESNPEIQQWMKEHKYTDYSKLEQYFETTYVR